MKILYHIKTGKCYVFEDINTLYDVRVYGYDDTLRYDGVQIIISYWDFDDNWIVKDITSEFKVFIEE